MQGSLEFQSLIAYGGHWGSLEFQTLVAYGDSYIAQDGSGIVGGKFVERAKSRLRMGTLINRALSGSELSAASRRINGNTATKFTYPTKALVILNGHVNQLLAAGFTSAAAIAGFTHALRSALAGLSADSKIEGAAMNKVGTWGTTTNAMFSGGVVAFTSTVGDYAETAVTVNSTGKVDVLMLGIDSAFVAPGSPYEIKVDGVIVATGTLHAQHVTSAAQPEAQGHTPLVVTVSGLTPGVRTVRITKPSGAGSFLFVDAILVRSVDPPPVILLKQPPLDWATVKNNYGMFTYGPVTDAERVGMNAMFDDVAADFSTVYVVDVEDGWDAATMVPTDALHLGDKGQSHYADHIVSVAQAIPFSVGLNSGVI